MEALYFLKFWRSSVLNKGDHHRPSSVVDTDYEFTEEDDSFFELELTVPDFDSSNCKNNSCPLDIDSNGFDNNKDQNLLKSAKFQTPSVSLSASSDSLSKRKILPIEPSPTSKPQSPISILKSSPRFRVLMFKKSKSMVAHETGGKTELKSKKEERKVFSVKFKLKEVANVAIFTRDNSLRRRISEESLSSDDYQYSSKLFSKYLKLIKPLYVKVSRKQREKTEFSSAVSPSSSPVTVSSGCSPPKKEKQQGSIPAGIRVVCKHLGKSRSASSAAIGVPPATVARRDDSLVLQQDGIQSAILHCKKSFNSASCRDSYLLSRFASDPMYDISMASPRISLQEEKGIMN